MKARQVGEKAAPVDCHSTNRCEVVVESKDQPVFGKKAKWFGFFVGFFLVDVCICVEPKKKTASSFLTLFGIEQFLWLSTFPRNKNLKKSTELPLDSKGLFDLWIQRCFCFLSNTSKQEFQWKNPRAPGSEAFHPELKKWLKETVNSKKGWTLPTKNKGKGARKCVVCSVHWIL